MFLWFGEGRYVIKALELKALHQPLSPEQQEKYDAYIEGRSAGENVDEELEVEEQPDESAEDVQALEETDYGETGFYGEEEDVLAAPTTELPEVKPVDVGQYNTINLQMALAESMKEVLDDGDDVSRGVQESEDEADMSEDMGEFEETADFSGDAEETASEETYEAGEAETFEEPEVPIKNEPIPFEEPRERKPQPSITDTIIAPLLEETAKLPNINALNEEELQTASEEIVQDDTVAFDAQKIIEEMTREAERLQARAIREQALAASKPTEYDKYLAQEYDGQISFVLPDAEKVEKQITGQLSIDDIMAEWEQLKKDNQEKRMEDVRQHIMAQTGSLFANFDEATKNGLLEELEKAFMAAIMKESSKNPHVKKVVFPDDMPEREVSVKKAEPAPARKEEPEPVREPEDTDTLEDADTKETDVQKPAGKPAREVAPAQEAGEADSGEETAKDRELSPEEQELFGKFVHQRKSKKQLIHVLDNMSLASCTGNIIITGEEEVTTISLAKALIREMQYNDSNFSGKVAKIEGHVLNKKDVEATFSKMDNGALIIVEAAKLKAATVASMVKVLEKENMGLLALLVGTKTELNELLSKHSALANSFNLRVDIEPLDNEALVAYAKQYAEEMEYSIDEFGILALHTRIADRQTSDHEVTLSEVKDLVDEAIEYANKKTPKHFMDILLAKRYDEEDMIILREKDFMHY